MNVMVLVVWVPGHVAISLLDIPMVVFRLVRTSRVLENGQFMACLNEIKYLFPIVYIDVGFINSVATSKQARRYYFLLFLSFFKSFFLSCFNNFFYREFDES